MARGGYVECRKRRQHVTENRGELGVTLGILLDFRPFAVGQPFQEGINDFAHERFC